MQRSYSGSSDPLSDPKDLPSGSYPPPKSSPYAPLILDVDSSPPAHLYSLYPEQPTTPQRPYNKHPTSLQTSRHASFQGQVLTSPYTEYENDQQTLRGLTPLNTSISHLHNFTGQQAQERRPHLSSNLSSPFETRSAPTRSYEQALGSSNGSRASNDHPSKRSKQEEDGPHQPQSADSKQVARPVPSLQAISNPVVDIASSLWRLSNPKAIANRNILIMFAQVFGEFDDLIPEAFWWPSAGSASPGTDAKAPTSPHVLKAIWRLWQQAHPGKQVPDQITLNHMSILFNIEMDVVDQMFPHTSIIDSGYGSKTQTGNTSLDRAIALVAEDTKQELINEYQGNRNHCLGKKMRVESPAFDSQSPSEKGKIYICPLSCGERFKRKESLDKHVRKSWVQELRICRMTGCTSLPMKKRIFDCKSSYDQHVKSRHKGLDSMDLISIPSNHPDTCVFQECPHGVTSYSDFLTHVCSHFKNRDWSTMHWRLCGDTSRRPGLGGCRPEESLAPNKDDDDGDSDDNDDSPPPPPTGEKNLVQSTSPRATNSSTSKTHGSNNETHHHSHTILHHSALVPASKLKPLDSSPPRPLLVAFKTTRAPFLNALGESQKSIPWEIQFLRRLGSSDKAVVHEVKIQGHRDTKACKSIQATTSAWPQHFVREVQNLSKLNHPHVIKYIDEVQQEDFMALFLQPAADSDLSHYLNACSCAQADVERLWQFYSCLTSALIHIHDQGVFHQDIKPSNILVQNRNILFADFGSSSTIMDDGSYLHTQDYTELYAAPEVRQGQRGPKSDVFSLGCVFLEMTTMLLSPETLKTLRKLQYETQSEEDGSTLLHWSVKWEKQLHVLESIKMAGTEIKRLRIMCHEMILPEPEKRPNAAEVQQRVVKSPCRPCKYGPKLKNGQKAATFPPDCPRSSNAARKYAAVTSSTAQKKRPQTQPRSHVAEYMVSEPGPPRSQETQATPRAPSSNTALSKRNTSLSLTPARWRPSLLHKFIQEPDCLSDWLSSSALSGRFVSATTNLNLGHMFKTARPTSAHNENPRPSRETRIHEIDDLYDEKDAGIETLSHSP